LTAETQNTLTEHMYPMFASMGPPFFDGGNSGGVTVLAVV